MAKTFAHASPLPAKCKLNRFGEPTEPRDASRKLSEFSANFHGNSYPNPRKPAAKLRHPAQTVQSAGNRDGDQAGTPDRIALWSVASCCSRSLRPLAPRMARALVFAHYDRDRIFDPHVVHALTVYRPLVDRLVVVSASARVLPEGLQPIVDVFIARDNVGYDFCSWRDGIGSLARVSEFDELVCTNDSVYGPLFDLAPAFRDPRIAAADFWGMCLSEQGTKRRGRGSCPHVQSWFFVMRRPLVQSAAFTEFWGSVEPQACKDDVIDRYEIGMTEHFARSGFQAAALYDARSHGATTWTDLRPHLSLAEPRRSWRHLKKARRRPHNPSELFPLRLLAAGVPFLKVGLFKVNHYGLYLPAVLTAARRLGTYDVGLVTDHLARVGRPAA